MMMEILKDKIASYVQEILNLCFANGLKTMDRATIIIRDLDNENMFVIVSNDTGEFQNQIEQAHRQTFNDMRYIQNPKGKENE